MQETTQLTYGEGSVTIVVSSESEMEVAAPAIRFGDYHRAVEASFTEKELKEISEGDSATLDFRYVMTEELSSKEQAGHFEDGIKRAEAVTGALKNGVFFEVEAVKSIEGKDADEVNTLYHDVEFQYEIPRYLAAEKRVYYAMTDVKGVCELEEDVDVDADTLSVSTHNVGTTLILYQDGKEKAEGKASRFTIKNQYLFILAIAALALVWWAMDRRHKRR